MDDLSPALSALDDIDVPVTWGDVKDRPPRQGVYSAGPSPVRRAVIVVVVLAVTVAVFAFSLRAFRDRSGSTSVPGDGGAGPTRVEPCSWRTVPGPSMDTGRYFNYLDGVEVIAKDDVWAFGGFGRGGEGDIDRRLMLHWDGTGWDTAPHPKSGPPSDMAAAGPDDLWAVGADGLVEHWDGAAWSVVPAVDPGTMFWHLWGVTAVGPDDVWAVGTAGGGRSGFGTLIEHWDGAAWSIVPSPLSLPADGDGPLAGAELTAVTALAPDDVWAVGDISLPHRGGKSTLILHWDGTEWSIVPSSDAFNRKGVPWNWPLSISAGSSDDVWVVGLEGADSLGGAPDHLLVEHWDGTSWSLVDAPGEERWNRFYDVAASPTGEAWAVGSTETRSGSRNRILLERWDGAAWRSEALPPVHGYSELSGVALVPSGGLWAVGTAGSKTLTLRCS